MFMAKIAMQESPVLISGDISMRLGLRQEWLNRGQRVSVVVFPCACI